MKTISGFTFLVILLYIFLCSPNLPAESPDSGPYTFSVAASGGFLYGQSEEIVYKAPNSDACLSQLLWDMKPLWYAGTSFNFSQINPMEKLGFFMDLSLKFGIPSKTGTMEDRDWTAADGHLTNFSSHDNYTRGAFILDFSAGLSVPIVSKALINLYLGFSYMNFSWDAHDGYIEYEKDNWEKIPFYGPAISYSQEWRIFLLGIGLNIPFKPFSIELSFQGSAGPFIYCADQDEHFSRNLQFRDYLSGGVLLEPRGGFAFSLHPKAELSLHIGWRYISGARGITKERETGLSAGGTFVKSGEAGAGYSMLDTGLSVKVRF
ncbi:MAG: omptin family outer membrane protease [Treponema sp.]|jgi:outer membrane protease|nr:omptin family outer membrane protease [Treponema sp.]